MHAIEQEQQILSEELKFDKRLKLSNGSQEKDNDSKEDDKDDGFKKIIKESIQSAESLKEKLGVKEISYPNDYVFASLANRVYEERENVKRTKDLYGKKLDQALGNWQLLTVAENTDNFNGYVGAAYWNPDTQQIIIAHRGTEPKDGSTILGTMFTNVKGIFFNQHAPQIDSAVTFTDEIISALKEINQEREDDEKEKPYIQLFFTGHSLGGWLAQITTFTAKYLISDGNNFVKNGNFEETGYHASAVIFDSPGGRDMLVRIQDRLMNRYGPSYIDSLDVIPISTNR
ncbi:DUF6792 domain-containing protein [Wolbachia endosymbiont of Oedothorax gibbosus]|uniref:DUF6792 domain-containing protein n=1 Tax=Wolbachia endosymbiont of Oedothorax gibbosus TaxID=931100 RepID=UPI002023E7B9|nr:DUF6792 domain-containing protein [Wolbachia endosymbiont of Oedothorax gibbosus]